MCSAVTDIGAKDFLHQFQPLSDQASHDMGKGMAGGGHFWRLESDLCGAGTP
jgi:hypothetical protein